MLKFNIDVPPNAYIFFKYVDEFLSMKAQFVEDFLEKFNSLFIPVTSQTTSQGDKDSNTNVIKNIGTIILSVVGLIFAMLFITVLIKY
jgi:hypothetical protein